MDEKQYKAYYESLKKDIEKMRDERRTNANTAVRVGGIILRVLDFMSAGGASLFLSRLVDDTANGLITFLKGIVSKARAIFHHGDGDNTAIEAHGDVTVNDGSVVSDDICSDGHNDTADQTGYGYHLKNDNGVSSLWIDNITVRKKWTATALDILKLSYSAGNITIDGAGGEIFAVAPFDVNGNNLAKLDDLVVTDISGVLVSDGGIPLSFGVTNHDIKGTRPAIAYYRCYFKASDGERNIMNEWHLGDIVKCQTFNLSDGTHQKASNRRYGRAVIGVSQETVDINGTQCFWIDLSNNASVQMLTSTTGEKITDASGNDVLYVGLLHTKAADGTITIVDNDAPEAGDVVAHVGSLSDSQRQSAVQLVAVGDGAPAIRLYRGINEILENISDHSKFLPIDLNPENSFINTQFVTFTNGYHSNSPYIHCGDYVAGQTSHHNEVWQYNGSSWVCNKETTSEPSDNNDAWTPLAHKGEQGIPGPQGIPGNNGHSPSVTISDDGYWIIDGTKTNTKAQGDAGHTPTITISSDGYWVIDGTKTNTKAKGDKGDSAVSYYIEPQAIIIQEGLNNSTSDLGKKYTKADFIYDIPSTIAIHKVVGSADTIIAADSVSVNKGNNSIDTAKISFSQGTGYSLANAVTAAKLRTTDDTEIGLVFTIKGQNGSSTLALHASIYINRMGTHSVTVYGDTSKAVSNKKYTWIDDSGKVHTDTLETMFSQTSQSFAQTVSENGQILAALGITKDGISMAANKLMLYNPSNKADVLLGYDSASSTFYFKGLMRNPMVEVNTENFKNYSVAYDDNGKELYYLDLAKCGFNVIVTCPIVDSWTEKSADGRTTIYHWGSTQINLKGLTTEENIGLEVSVVNLVYNVSGSKRTKGSSLSTSMSILRNLSTDATYPFVTGNVLIPWGYLMRFKLVKLSGNLVWIVTENTNLIV